MIMFLFLHPNSIFFPKIDKILFNIMNLIISLMACLIIVSSIRWAGLAKVISSPVVRCRDIFFCFNVVVGKHLCYLFDDLFVHCEQPLVGWPRESAI